MAIFTADVAEAPAFNRQQRESGNHTETGALVPERQRVLVENAEGAEEPQRIVCAVSFWL